MSGRRALRSLLGALTFVTYLFMLAPALVCVVLAFNTSPSSTFPMTGLTLRWFAELAQDDAVLSALWNSLVLAACASALSTLVGTAAALALSRFRFNGRATMQLTLTVPILVPHIVLGVGLLLAFRMFGLSKSFPLLVIGHMAMTLPYVVLTTGHRLRAIPANIEEAARTLGANRTQTFFAIILPLALPAVLASLLFAFMSSFDEVTATLFWLPANMQTVPTQIMAMLQFSVDQKINALAALLIFGSVILAAAALALGRVLSVDDQKPRGNRP
jgi:spermidine/putrescine transport system permease protein